MNKDHLKKFTTFSVKDFDEFHRQSFPNANEITHKSFAQGLKRIEKIFKDKIENLNLKFIEDPKDLFNSLQTSDYSHNTNITTFCMVLKLLKLLGVSLQHYNKFQNLMNIMVKENQVANESILKEKLNYMPDFATLKNIVRKKIEAISATSTFDEVKHLLIVAIMTLAVPLKVSQYAKMKIVLVEPDSNYLNNFLLEDLSGNFFLKCKKNTGDNNEVSVKLVDDYLIDLLKLWINEFNTTKHLFITREDAKTGMNRKDLNIVLASATQSIFNIQLSNTDLRDMYMKNLMDLDPSYKQKIAISQMLGYVNNDCLELHNI